MAIVTRDTLTASLRTIIGDAKDDTTLAFLEDFADTMADLETRASSDTDWQSKYDELDKSWREKYTARFFDGQTTPEDVKSEQKKDVIDDGETVSFEDLFVGKEG